MGVLHNLQAFDNKESHDTSLSIAEAKKCQFFTIRDIAMHFGYSNGGTQIVCIFYTPFINKMRNVC